jgi:AcrR family transcriptional regulator
MTGKARMARPQRREAILHSAARAFAAQGFSSTSMEDVAAEAGVTRLILYRHFESKEALYEAVLERVATRLTEEMASGVGSGEAPLSRPAVRAVLVVAREDPAAFTLLWRHAAREPAFASYAHRFRAGATEFALGLMRAAGVSGRLRERWAAQTLVAYVIEAVLAWLDEGREGRDDEFLELMSASLPALVGAWARA